jgi:hypothetical protein
MLLFLLYSLVTIVLCVILYRELELTKERKSKKYNYYYNEDSEYLLFVGRILWPISIPIYLFYLLVEILVKRLYKIISKFIK